MASASLSSTLMDYERLFAALQKMEAERRIRAPVADAIRIIAMTGARRCEVTALRWREVEAGRIRLPAGRHKTGRQTGKPRIIQLPAMAQQIIARQPPGAPDDFVFSPARDGGPLSLAKPWAAIRKEAGSARGDRPAWSAAQSRNPVGGRWAQAAEIMTSLGHRQLSTTAKYLHFADKARASLAERAAAPALAGMAAAMGTPVADVIALPGSKARG